MSMSIDRKVYDGEPQPVSYDLVCRLDNNNIPVLILSASNAVVSQLSSLPAVAYFQSKFKGIGEFVKSTEALGYGGILKPAEPFLPLEGFSTWEAVLPAEVIGKNGSDWLSAWQLSCSISILTGGFFFIESEPNKLGLQQLAVHAICCQGYMGGCALAATLSPTVRQWIESHRQTAEYEARKTMVAVYDRMWPNYLSRDRNFRLHNFRVSDNDRKGNGFMMDVPGSATGLYVDGMDLERGPGWNLDSHNVDQPTQQLSLLAGLGLILRLVRELQLTH